MVCEEVNWMGALLINQPSNPKKHILYTMKCTFTHIYGGNGANCTWNWMFRGRRKEEREKERERKSMFMLLCCARVTIREVRALCRLGHQVIRVYCVLVFTLSFDRLFWTMSESIYVYVMYSRTHRLQDLSKQDRLCRLWWAKDGREWKTFR